MIKVRGHCWKALVCCKAINMQVQPQSPHGNRGSVNAWCTAKSHITMGHRYRACICATFYRAAAVM